MGKFISRVFVAVSILVVTLVPTLTVTVSASPSINEYPVPTSNAIPLEITSGPDGNLWFTEQLGDQIGRITPSGTITEFPVPTAIRVGSITTGPDGNLWFTFTGNNNNNGAIGEITTSGVITEFPLPVYGVSIGGITTGPDGNLWFTESQNRISDMIGEITTSGNVTQYPITPYTGDSGYIGDIVTGSDGALWFTMTQDNQIGRITTSGAIKVYQISTASAFPFGIASGPDGNLWFTEQNGDKIGQITTSGSVTEFPIPTNLSSPVDIATGPDGDLWFTEASANQVGQITTSGSVTEYPTPTANSNPYGIAVGSDGALWFTETGGSNGAIGRIAPDLSPTSPTNLTAPSPTQYPALSWTSVSGATSYNIFRNGNNIGSSTTANFTDNSAPEGNDSYYVTAVNSEGESGASNTVSVLVDRTPPTITYTLSTAPNSADWNNGPVTVTFICTDNVVGSGVATCSSPQTESNDGEYVLSGYATDNAGNMSSVNVAVNIDQTAPTVSNVTLATDPIPVNQSTTLSANVTDNLSGVAKAEYYAGTDLGVGNGTPMTVSNGIASATVGSYGTAGSHTYYVRTEDNAGNWSQPMMVTLDVYNPAGGYSAAHGTIVPNGPTSNPGDVLPTETGNNLKASLDYTVKYVSSTSTTPTGTSTFSWGSTCNNPHSNCFVVTTNTTTTPLVGSLAWLIVPGDNTATFQGTATLSQGNTVIGTNYPIRVTASGTTTTSPGHYLLQVFAVGADPNTATPIYQASGDLTGGSVVLHS